MIPFLFAVHAHQPVGNFDWVFEKVLDKCYQPALEAFSNHPSFKLTLHYSGSLLEWMEEHAPGHVELIRAMVERGQLELMGGGYYEPILTAIPERDARAQVLSYHDHLEQLFGKRPRGLWLTERVWDPILPRLLSELEVNYTLVDDSHFLYAGLSPDQIYGPFLAEREGRTVTVLPIDKTLRYLIPFREPEETIAYLKKRAREAPGFVGVYGDDLEKFGVWPETHEWVFERGWLERFLSALDEARDEIRTLHYSEFLATARPRGRAYLPPASYEEMMEWALPPELGERLERLVSELKEQGRWEEFAPLVRGGHWDLFLSKYEESNRLHKRMLRCSDRIHRKAEKNQEAQRRLHRGQCNCAYWHGVFGGLYLGHLRHAVYQELLAAEAAAGLNRSLEFERVDYDRDGCEEIMVNSPSINVIVHPARGGAVGTIEDPVRAFSLSNVMSRRRETYHARLTEAVEREAAETPATIHERVAVKEEGLDKLLIYDRFPRMSLQDHVVPPLLSLQEIEGEATLELGEFAGAPYLDMTPLSLGAERPEWPDRKIELGREDFCGEVPLAVEKTIAFEKNRAGFSVHYRVSSRGERMVSFRFGVEWNLNLLSGDSPGRFCLIDGERPEDPGLAGREEREAVEKIELVNQDDGFEAVIACSAPALLFRYPLETVSQSESGFERSFQGTCLWFTWPLRLRPGQGFRVSLEFDLRKLA